MKNIKRLFLALAVCLVIAGVAAPIQSEAASVKLNKTKTTVYAGKKTTLKVKNTKKKVKWSTSKKSVATVSSKGVVTGKKHGTATITAKVGTKKYTCKVTVKARLSKTKATVKANEKLTLSMIGKSKTVKWSSSKKSVATVSSKGVVTAKKAGTTTITAKMGSYKKTCKITVVPKISYSKKTIYIGKTTTLKVYGTSSKVSWSSSKTSVATVSSKGIVTAKKAGTATITAKVGTKKYTCKVTVKSVYSGVPKSLSLVNSNWIKLETVKITKLQVVSADPTVASVVLYDEWLGTDYGYADYVVYGHKTGSTTITITNNYSGEKIIIPVTVTKPENPSAYQKLVNYVIDNGSIAELGDKAIYTERTEEGYTIIDMIAYSAEEDSLVFGTVGADEAEEKTHLVALNLIESMLTETQAIVMYMDFTTEEEMTMIMAAATFDAANYDRSDVEFIDAMELAKADEETQALCNGFLREMMTSMESLLAGTELGIGLSDLGFTAYAPL